MLCEGNAVAVARKIQRKADPRAVELQQRLRSSEDLCGGETDRYGSLLNVSGDRTDEVVEAIGIDDRLILVKAGAAEELKEQDFRCYRKEKLEQSDALLTSAEVLGELIRTIEPRGRSTIQ